MVWSFTVFTIKIFAPLCTNGEGEFECEETTHIRPVRNTDLMILNEFLMYEYRVVTQSNIVPLVFNLDTSSM